MCGQQTEAYPADQGDAVGHTKAGAGEHGPEEESWSKSPKERNSSHHDGRMQR